MYFAKEYILLLLLVILTRAVLIIHLKSPMHYRLRGSIGKKSFFLKWLAFAHFWSNFDEIFCAGVKP